MKLLAAGSNARGQLASGDDVDSSLFRAALFSVAGESQSESPGPVLQIACGSNHTLALLQSSSTVSSSSVSVWGAGDGSRGQLGPRLAGQEPCFQFTPLHLGDTLPNGEIVTIRASWETSFIVVRTEDMGDRIFSFGSNDFGILGTGASETLGSSTSPQEVPLQHLFSQPIDSIRVTHLEAGPRHVLAVIRYAVPGIGRMEMLVGWGAGRKGQLAILRPNTEKEMSGPRRVPLPVRITTWSYPVSIVELSVGYHHSLLLTSDGHILRIGSNAKLQLPPWDTGEEGVYLHVQCTWHNSFVAAGPSLFSYGQNSHGQLGRVDAEKQEDRVTIPSGFDWSIIVGGSEHCLLIGKSVGSSEEPRLLAWGWNEHGNLAIGHNKDVFTPQIVASDDSTGSAEESQSKIVEVWAGCGTSWLAVENIVTR